MLFRSFRSKPYLCPAGIPTIGYGSTIYRSGQKVTLNDAPITEEQAEEMMLFELQTKCAPSVMRLCPGLVGQEARFNAIVDFVYNLGAGRLQTSTLRRKVNSEDWTGVKQQLMRWVRGGGKVLSGLQARRQAECDLIG